MKYSLIQGFPWHAGRRLPLPPARDLRLMDKSPSPGDTPATALAVFGKGWHYRAIPMTGYEEMA